MNHHLSSKIRFCDFSEFKFQLSQKASNPAHSFLHTFFKMPPSKSRLEYRNPETCNYFEKNASQYDPPSLTDPILKRYVDFMKEIF